MDLYHNSGINISIISAIEKGHVIPGTEILEKLAFALAVSPPKVLVGEAEIKTEDVIAWGADVAPNQ